MTNKNILKLLVASACSLSLLAVAAPAEAGRGGSINKIRASVNAGSIDGIVAELERAEYLICNSECINFVMGLLDHDSYYVREGAAWWFARRPAQKKELHESSVAYLVTGDSIQVRNAADILGTFKHPQAVSDLTTALNRTDVNEGARVAIVRALGTIASKSGNQALTVAMGDSSSAVRLQAVTAWRTILRQDQVAPVATLVADSDVTVRRAAIATVGYYKYADARVSLETQLTSDSDAAARRNAAWALGQIGDLASTDVLVTATSDDSLFVRNTAKAALRLLR